MPNEDKITRLALLVGTIFFVFHFLFLWLYTNIDGYFYWAIGHYLKTGSYPFISPFIYARPTTISPPLYGIFLSVMGILNHADIIIHAVQLTMLGVTCILIYKILVDYISKSKAALFALINLFFPANVIYTSSMMSEINAQLLMTIYVYLMHRASRTKHLGFLSWMVFIAAVATLLKYQFLVLMLLSLIIYCYFFFRSHKKLLRTLIPILLGVGIIFIWIYANHTITGVWGLSDTKKMPFYTNFVWDGKHYPKNTDPSVLALRRYVPATADRFAEYWDLQDYILPHVNRDWRVIDDLLGNVGIAAIKEQPIPYALNAMRIFFQIHVKSAPWWFNLETFGTININQPLFCDSLETIRFCKPIILTFWSYRLWNAYVSISKILYNTIFPIFSVLVFFPSLVRVLLLHAWDKRIFGLVYLANLLPISFLAFVESRYLVPFYPLMIIITVLGWQSINKYFSLIKVRIL